MHTIQGDTNPTVIPRKCTRRKQVKSDLISSTFCFTVERIEKDLDDFSAQTTMCIWFLETVLPSTKGAKIAAVKMSLKNIFPHKTLPFHCGRIEASIPSVLPYKLFDALSLIRYATNPGMTRL